MTPGDHRTAADLQDRVEELEAEVSDLEAKVSDLEAEVARLERAVDPGQVLADRLRALLAELTCFPERDCPDFYNALDAYDVAYDVARSRG